jgi:hypothetical protein
MFPIEKIKVASYIDKFCGVLTVFYPFFHLLLNNCQYQKHNKCTLEYILKNLVI